MDDQQEAKTVPFPNPPAYLWQDFTPENVGRIDGLRASQADAGRQQHSRLAQIPADLVNLNPPAEPADGKWRLYGGQYDLRDNLPSLEEQGIERLSASSADHTNGKPIDKILELKRLSKSLLLNFLELVGVFASNPEASSLKVQDLHTLFINTHHILNEWRPHQTSEALISLMQDQLEKTQKETNAIREVTENGRAVLKRLACIREADVQLVHSLDDSNGANGHKNTGVGGGDDGEGVTTKAQFGEARRVEAWKFIDDLFPSHESSSRGGDE